MAGNKCPAFEVKVKSNIEDVYDEVVKQAKAAGLDVKGDAKKGTVKHNKYKVEGKYTSKGNSIKFEMTEDEPFDQCRRIEKEITKALKGI